MKKFILLLIVWAVAGLTSTYAQSVKLDTTKLEAVSVSMSSAKIMGKGTIQVVKASAVKAVDEPTFAKLKGVNFKNGTIEVKVLSRLLKDAPADARGFIGLAFRINDNNSKFECIYVRPTNGRVEIQLRRNRSTQYFSFSDFKFDRLRKEAPGEYESYVDIGLNEWIDLKIEVKGAKAKLFVNGTKQPVLIVNDLKHGADLSGAVGLWVDVGTEGYFADLKIRNDESKQ
ncbi:MAG: hypothetical protein JNM09_02105 [Blastocatellia bacterium]|nr:hypothetical protein [Blastocatellia bacterium]